MQLILDHWGTIATILFALSELIGTDSALASNSLYQLVRSWIATQKK